jgi:hypothetical protein
MDRFPRGSIPPAMFRAVATIAPTAIAKPEPELTTSVREAVSGGAEPCDLSTTCPTCNIEMRPEHAHYRCPTCGYRDSCCF